MSCQDDDPFGVDLSDDDVDVPQYRASPFLGRLVFNREATPHTSRPVARSPASPAMMSGTFEESQVSLSETTQGSRDTDSPGRFQSCEEGVPDATPRQALSKALAMLESRLDLADDPARKVDILQLIVDELHKGVRARDARIEDLLHKDAENCERVKFMSHELEQYKNAHEEAEYRLDNELENLDGEPSDLAAAYLEIEDLKHQAAIKDELFSKTASELSNLKKTLNTLTESLERKDLATEKKDRQIESKTRELAEKDEVIAKKDRRSAKKTYQLAVISGQLVEKTTQIDDMKADLEEKDSLLASRLAEKDRIIGAKDAQIEEQETRLAAQRTALDAKEAEVAEVNARLDTVQEALLEAEAATTEAQDDAGAAWEALEEKEEEVEEKEHDLLMKDCTITDLEHKVLTKDNAIKDRERKLALKEKRMEKRDRLIASHEVTIAKNAKALKANNRIIMKLSRQVDGLNLGVSRLKKKAHTTKSTYKAKLRDAQWAKELAEAANVSVSPKYAEVERKINSYGAVRSVDDLTLPQIYSLLKLLVPVEPGPAALLKLRPNQRQSDVAYPNFNVDKESVRSSVRSDISDYGSNADTTLVSNDFLRFTPSTKLNKNGKRPATSTPNRASKRGPLQLPLPSASRTNSSGTGHGTSGYSSAEESSLVTDSETPEDSDDNEFGDDSGEDSEGSLGENETVSDDDDDDDDEDDEDDEDDSDSEAVTAPRTVYEIRLPRRPVPIIL